MFKPQDEGTRDFLWQTHDGPTKEEDKEMGIFRRKKKEECPHCGRRSLVDPSADTVICCYCGLRMAVAFAKKREKPPTVSEPIE